MFLRFVFTKGIAMFKAAILKESEKKYQKTNYEKFLNDQKYHEIL